MLAVELPPHARRLLDLLRRQPASRIQLWGWPGSGAREVLLALAQEEGRRATIVDPSPLGFVRRSPEVRWLLWTHPEPVPPEIVERFLPAGVRFVFASEQRSESVPDLSLIQPAELLLTEAEVAALVERHRAGGSSPEKVRRLWQASDGWLAPLEQALAAGAGARRLEITAASLVAVPAVASFLRHQVFEQLPEPLRDLLVELSAGDSLEEEPWRRLWGEGDERLAELTVLAERHGLVVAPLGRPHRLPRLLVAFLHTERSRRWPVARSFALQQRLAVLAYNLGQPARALSSLTEASDPLRLAALLELEWLELVATAPLDSLRSALRLVAPLPSLEGELLTLAVDAAVGERRRAATALHELASRLENQPGAGAEAITAAARLFSAALRAPRTAPEVAAVARQKLHALPERLEDLIEALEGRATAPPAPAAAPVTVIDHLLLLWARSEPAAGEERPWTARAGAERIRPEPGQREMIEVRLFGLPRVLREDEAGLAEVKWPLRKSFLVLAYLASSPDVAASREEIVEAVWGEAARGAVERNFHPTISHLRRTLAPPGRKAVPPLLLTAGVYRLNPEIGWRIDVRDFESLLERGNYRREAGDMPGAVELWQAAWRQYSGPFLEGLYPPWVLARREGFASAYSELLRRLGEALVESGDLQRALDAYRTLLLADPLQERAHLAVMRLYARMARRDLVRRQYERLATLLREELGVEPALETLGEYHRLMG